MARKNALINGDFGIWQRGTQFNSPHDDTYLVDRWNTGFSVIDPGDYIISRQSFDLGQTEVPGNPQYYIRWNQTTPGTERFLDFSQQIENVRTFSGQQVIISAWIRTSPASSPQVSNLFLKTEQYFGSTPGQPAPQSAFTCSSPLPVTNDWTRLTFPTALASIQGKTLGTNGDDSINVIISLPVNQAFSIDIADVQIELGSTATAFDRLPIVRQLADCQRYFQKSYDLDTEPGTQTYQGSVNFRQLSDNHVQPVHLGPSMRCPPDVTLYNPDNGNKGTWQGENNHETQVTAGDIGENYFHVDVTDGRDRDSMAGHWTADAEFDVMPPSSHRQEK